MSSRRGFTLVELMVVVGIIIIMAAMMAPGINNWMKKFRLKQAGEAIINTMNQARSQAVLQRQPVYLIFLRDRIELYSTRDGNFFEKIVIAGNQMISFRLPFYDEDKTNKDLNEDVVADETTNDRGERAYEISTDEGDNVMLRFEPTGTIDFLWFDDIPTDTYTRNISADVYVEQVNNELKGFLDVRAAGMANYKVEIPGDGSNQ